MSIALHESYKLGYVYLICMFNFFGQASGYLS